MSVSIMSLLPTMQPVKHPLMNWIIFIALSFIWGSSFILMKRGLYDAANNILLNAWQVAALRIGSAGIVLIPFAVKAAREVPRNKWVYVLLSGLLGSFFPAFLFCIAETKIDGALAGTLNALTPIFVIITGFLLYRTRVPVQKVTGVLVAFAGCVLLLLTKEAKANDNTWFAGFVLIATICYGINVNMVRRRLQEIGSMSIASLALVSLIIPCLLILWLTHYFDLPLLQTGYLRATAASAVLGILGTAIASVLFYVLVKRAGTIFSSMVTYGIPFVAIFWGVLDGEHITPLQVVSLGIILVGVFLSNK